MIFYNISLKNQKIVIKKTEKVALPQTVKT